MARSSKDAPGFRPGVKVCYPAHGVGDLQSIEEENIDGSVLELYVISFPRHKLVLRVPTQKAIASGLVTLEGSISEMQVRRALKIIGQDRKVSKAMWNRRSAEYEQKVNTSNLTTIAEVVRDLNRGKEDLTERSYSENEILRKAGQRFVDLLAAYWQQDEVEVQLFLNQHLKAHHKNELPFQRW